MNIISSFRSFFRDEQSHTPLVTTPFRSPRSNDAIRQVDRGPPPRGRSNGSCLEMDPETIARGIREE